MDIAPPKVFCLTARSQRRSAVDAMYESIVSTIHDCVQLLCRGLLRALQWLPLGWHDRAAAPLSSSKRSAPMR